MLGALATALGNVGPTCAGLLSAVVAGRLLARPASPLAVLWWVSVVVVGVLVFLLAEPVARRLVVLGALLGLSMKFVGDAPPRWRMALRTGGEDAIRRELESIDAQRPSPERLARRNALAATLMVLRRRRRHAEVVFRVGQRAFSARVVESDIPGVLELTPRRLRRRSAIAAVAGIAAVLLLTTTAIGSRSSNTGGPVAEQVFRPRPLVPPDSTSTRGTGEPEDLGTGGGDGSAPSGPTGPTVAALPTPPAPAAPVVPAATPDADVAATPAPTGASNATATTGQAGFARLETPNPAPAAPVVDTLATVTDGASAPLAATSAIASPATGPATALVAPSLTAAALAVPTTTASTSDVGALPSTTPLAALRLSATVSSESAVSTESTPADPIAAPRELPTEAAPPATDSTDVADAPDVAGASGDRTAASHTERVEDAPDQPDASCR